MHQSASGVHSGTITDGLFRLSLGIEDEGDLARDLARALR